jgi:hypothetical protein
LALSLLVNVRLRLNHRAKLIDTGLTRAGIVVPGVQAADKIIVMSFRYEFYEPYIVGSPYVSACSGRRLVHCDAMVATPMASWKKRTPEHRPTTAFADGRVDSLADGIAGLENHNHVICHSRTVGWWMMGSSRATVPASPIGIRLNYGEQAQKL